MFLTSLTFGISPVSLFSTVSLRWTKLPPVRTGGREHTREVPYMRYGHTAVLLDETIFIWGGRNDTEGACNVLYAFDVSRCRSNRIKAHASTDVRRFIFVILCFELVTSSGFVVLSDYGFACSMPDLLILYIKVLFVNIS